MSGFTFSGIASGLDTSSIVAQLVALKRQPIVRLQQRRGWFEQQKSALGDLETKLKALQTAAKALDTSSEFGAFKATTSDEDILTASAGSTATPGSYNITVNSLAAAQKDISQSYDSLTAEIGAGTFSITVDGEETEITLAAGSSSLSDLRDEINDAEAGVNATILNDGSDNYYLIFTADETGTDASFSFDWSGLSGGTVPTLTSETMAVNASLVIDGIAVTSQTNSVTEAITGLTIDLVTADVDSEIAITVESDPEAIQKKVKSLVTAYNALFAFVSDQSAEAGTLRRNSTMRTVADRMANLFTDSYSGGSSTITLMAQIGISQEAGRQIDFDTTEFQDALSESYAGVRDLFIKDGDDEGKAYQIQNVIDDLTDSIDGLFKISKESLDDKIENVDDTIVRYERSVGNYQTTLERKFTAMELLVSNLQSQGNYLYSVIGR
ncbi:MAG: flagellar filament capping protein FliD [bacterium]